MNYTEEQKQKIREEIPRILRPLIDNSTPLAVAILNLKDNKYAMGSIAGAALASLSVLPIDVLVDFFHANKAWVYAAAGSGIETTASFIWGKVQTNKDAYKEFTKQFKQKPSVE